MCARLAAERGPEPARVPAAPAGTGAGGRDARYQPLRAPGAAEPGVGGGAEARQILRAQGERVVRDCRARAVLREIFGEAEGKPLEFI